MKKLAALTLKAKIIIAATSAAVVAAGAVGTVMLLNNKEESYRVVKVFETQGQYNTVDRGTSGTLDAYSGMNLQNGDIVTTGTDSNMRISLDGDKYILIDHNSEVQLVAENTAKDSKTVIELKKGEILNEITEPLSENSTYEVNTPKATMAVRGTSFYVQTEEIADGSYMTDLEVVHGKVAVWLYDESGNKKGDEVYVSEGYKVTIVIDPNENSENTPDIDGNAYFVYRTDDGGYIECKDTDPAPYKTDFSLMPDLIKQTALASDDSGLLKLDAEIEKILRGEETQEVTTAPTETSDTESSTETYETTTPETTTMADETSETLLPDVTTEAPETVTELSESETTVPSATDAITESSSETTTTTTAQPEPETATVLFADRSGNIIEQKEIEIGKSIGALPMVPSVVGHTGKWTINGEEISDDYVVMGDVTVLAVYTINKYTVTFKSAETDVTMPEAKTFEYNSLLELPEVPEKTGYTGKWTIDGNEIAEGYKVTEDLTVTAVYTINKYTVTFETKETGVTMSAARTVEYGSKLTLPAVPTKTGYTGVWVIDGEEVTGEYTVTDDVTITAVYTINKYTVTFETKETGVTMPAARTVEYGSKLTLPAVPTKTGYTGVWQIDGTAVTGEYTVTDDVTVTAVYTINKYTVTFETEASGVTMPAARTVEYGSKLTLPAVPTKTGYTGVWVIDGEEVTGTYTVTDDVTVTAVYTINKYTVTFETKETGVTMPAARTVEYGSKLTLPAVPTKTGYTGVWQIDGEEVTGTYTVTDDVTVTAVYTINKYTVTFETKETGVTMPEAKTFEYNSTLELPEVPEKTGYTGKWTIDGNDITEGYKVTEDLTVTAVYTINTYTVTFECDDETLTMPEKQKADYGTKLSEVLGKVQMPDKEGYTGKWTIGGEDIPDDSVVTDDVTITVVYTINTYEVTFTTDEPDITNLPTTEILEHGWGLANYLPEMPEKEGYTGRWTIDGEEIPDGYEVTGNITVKFEYVINSYEITFECDYDDVTMPDPITAEYGTPLSEALANYAVPEKPWYNGKWTVDGQSIANVTVKDNITVTAVYTHIEVSVYVDYVGGYSDDGNFDPSSLRLVSYADSSTFEYIMTAEELQIQISEWKNSASNYYTVAKAVYLNDERSLSGLDNPFDIEGLPEITENTLVKDIAYDYEYEGTYQSFVRIYLVPAWENMHKVTFHDVDGKEIESHYTTDYGSLKELPTAPDGYTWVYYNPNQSLDEFFAMQSPVNADTHVYCGVKITAHSYYEDGWSEFGTSVCKMAGGTLTDDDLKELAPYGETIAGFITEPVNDVSEITEFYSAGNAVNSNLELYIVRAKIDYTTLDGNSGTLYWLGDGSLMDKLNALRTSENYIWKFDNANGDVVSEDTLYSRFNYDYDAEPDNSQTGARFKVVETE